MEGSELLSDETVSIIATGTLKFGDFESFKPKWWRFFRVRVWKKWTQHMKDLEADPVLGPELKKLSADVDYFMAYGERKNETRHV